MLLGCDLDWFAVVTHPQGEKRARLALERHAIACFLPTYSKIVRRRGVRKFAERMLLPGYVLVGFPRDGQRWHLVRESFGVLGVVSAGDRPLAIPGDVVGTLMVGAMLGRFDVEQHRLGARVVTLPPGPGNPIKKFGRIVSLVEKPASPGVSVLWTGHGAQSVSTVPLDALTLIT